jgi:HAD superfamily hydrolase (TIGR01509 family)
MEYHYQAFREVLLAYGRELSRDEYFGELIGLRNDAILLRLLGPLPEQEVARLKSAKEEAYRRLIAGRVEALPGAAEMIGRARTNELRQAIVSSTPRDNIALVLRSLGLEEAFDAIVGEEDAARGKPDPEGFSLAATRLGVVHGECIVIEDAPEGIAAAKAAGMRCIGVTTTRPPERLSQADLVVASLEDERVWRFVAAP